MENNIKKRNELLLETVKKALNKRNFESFICKSETEIKDLILKLINKNETISYGGSTTLDELGIKNFLKDNNYNLIDRDSAKSPKEKEELILKGLRADTFLMSANAISQDGEIVNIDGVGNRIAALCYGPKQVIIIIGTNKIVKTLQDAISRARNYAAPINAQRVSKFIKLDTPCLCSGICMDCKSQTSICSHILTTRLCFPKGRIKVIMVNKNLGF